MDRFKPADCLYNRVREGNALAGGRQQDRQSRRTVSVDDSI
jgi:hypothetical protein